jgi:hypothetical protein
MPMPQLVMVMMLLLLLLLLLRVVMVVVEIRVIEELLLLQNPVSYPHRHQCPCRSFAAIWKSAGKIA